MEGGALNLELLCEKLKETAGKFILSHLFPAAQFLHR